MWFSSCRPMFKHLSESRSVTMNDWRDLEHYVESDTLPMSSCDPASSQLSSCLSGLLIFAQPLLKTNCFSLPQKTPSQKNNKHFLTLVNVLPSHSKLLFSSWRVTLLPQVQQVPSEKMSQQTLHQTVHPEAKPYSWRP